jgi:GT2 family glycosyltransferase
VIVVDDGSGKPPEDVLDRFRPALNVKLFVQEHAGPATARNTGAASAKGEFLSFTDDDCEPAPDWLRNLAARLVTTPDCIIGGPTINTLKDNVYSSASQMLIDYLYSYFNTDAHRGPLFFTSSNLAVSAAKFQESGGFDTTFPLAAAEDREFCDRWRRQGRQLIYAPEIQVYHSHELTLRSFCRQHYSYGRGALHFHQKRARSGAGRIKLEPPSFYLELLFFPLSRQRRSKEILFGALLAASQLANAAGFFGERIYQSKKRITLRTQKLRTMLRLSCWYLIGATPLVEDLARSVFS